MPRSWTNRLRNAKENGAKIVCSVAPYEGWEVTYLPRFPKDHAPWVIIALQIYPNTTFRYSGRECHAIVPAESGVTDCACCGSHIYVENIRVANYCDDCPDHEACEEIHEF